MAEEQVGAGVIAPAIHRHILARQLAGRVNSIKSGEILFPSHTGDIAPRRRPAFQLTRVVV